MSGVLDSLCDDDNPCTEDTCDPSQGCVHPAVPDDTECSDGDVCNGLELCQDAVCAPGVPLDCGDGNLCTTDECHPTLGCQNPPRPDGASCADDDVCDGPEECLLGQCVDSDALECDDGNDCTVDACDPATGCVHTLITGEPCNPAFGCKIDEVTLPCAEGDTCPVPCEDGDPCTLRDTCSAAGVCISGPVCDDLDHCTHDVCTAAHGCVHYPETTCDDACPLTFGEGDNSLESLAKTDDCLLDMHELLLDAVAAGAFPGDPVPGQQLRLEIGLHAPADDSTDNHLVINLRIQTDLYCYPVNVCSHYSSPLQGRLLVIGTDRSATPPQNMPGNSFGPTDWGDAGMIAWDDVVWLHTSTNGTSSMIACDNSQIHPFHPEHPWFTGGLFYMQEGNDKVISSNGPDQIRLGSGNDYAVAQGGADVVCGESDTDQLIGGFTLYSYVDNRLLRWTHDGDDRMFGGSSGDRIYSQNGHDIVFGGSGDDWLHAGEDDWAYSPFDRCTDRVHGGAGNDELFGGGGDDWLYGGAGDDLVIADDDYYSEPGNDWVFGQGGVDHLEGRDGDDVLCSPGGSADELLVGGNGSDTVCPLDATYCSVVFCGTLEEPADASEDYYPVACQNASWCDFDSSDGIVDWGMSYESCVSTCIP